MTNQTRRSEDTGLLKQYERWKVVLGGLLGLIAGLGIFIARADSVARNSDKVPAIEEAVLKLTMNQEEFTRLVTKMEARVTKNEERSLRAERDLGTVQREINDKLDVLVERR